MSVIATKFLKRSISSFSISLFGILFLVIASTLLTPSSASSAPSQAGSPPYPPSPLIERIDWDFNTHVRLAPGSDLWPVTWGPDDNIYTSWGDGGGFNGTNSDGRVSLGFAKIGGGPENFTTSNIWGGKDRQNPAQFGGKTATIISVDGTLYSWINTQNRSSGPDFKIAWSDDLGANWQQSSWTMNSSSFALAAFLNFGKDNAGSRDGYVYSYGGKWGSDAAIYLARVLKEDLKNNGAYEYLSGFNNGVPTWSSNASDRQPVFEDPNGSAFNSSLITAAIFNPGLGRYLLTTPHGDAGQWGVYDAPEPWGPWTTAGYYDDWGGFSSDFRSEALAYSLSTKWLGNDGLTLWNFFSGVGGALDSFNLVKGTVVLRDDIPTVSVDSNGDEIVVTSSDPSWKATFSKSRGGALWDLRIPADSPDSVIFNPNSPGALQVPVVYGALNEYMFRASDNSKFFSSQPSQVSRFEVIESTPTLVRIAVKGVSSGNGFTFEKTITVAPSGIRLDGESVPSTTVWHFSMPNNFAAGNLSKSEMALFDEDSGPVPFVMNSVADSGRKLPSGIDYPVSVTVPYKKDPSLSFRLRTIEAPPELVEKRVWSAISWGEHNVGNGAFGVDIVNFTSGPASVTERESGVREPQYPAGLPINYAWSFQIGNGDRPFPNIPGPGENGGVPPVIDAIPPEVERVSAGLSSVRVVYNEAMDESTVTDVSNYAIDNGIQVLTASMEGDDTVLLGTTEHTIGISYTISIGSVEDTAGNRIQNTQMVYSVNESPTVSNVTAAGSVSEKPYEVGDNASQSEIMYIDRSYTFTDVPGDVEGATYIKTANNDKTNTRSSFLTFSVDRDVTVYVAYDARATSIPNWMSGWDELNGFLGTSDSDRKLYFKDYASGGISLGGNMAQGASGAGSNYSVLILSNEGGEDPPPPVPNLLPVADFSATPTSGDAPLTVDFDASASGDSDGSIVSYDWDFGDGDFGTGGTMSHLYDTSGTYVVTLTVTDDDGDSDTAQTTITADEPQTSISVMLNVQSGSVDVGGNIDIPIILEEVPVNIAGFEFNFILSNASKARIVSVDFADFGLVDDQIVSNSQVFMTAIDINGVFQLNERNVRIATIKLRSEQEGTTSMSLGGVDMQNFDGESIESASSPGTLTVMNVTPVVVIDAEQGVIVGANNTLSVTGSFSDPADTSWTATVNYGDGSGTEALTLDGNSFTLSHIYIGGGDYTITVSITDDDGAKGVATLDVIVIGVFPTLPGMPGPSQDLDGDGKAEDVNGNGRGDFADVVVLFDNLDSSQVQQSPFAFDFNRNTRVDMADVIELFNILLR